ncbi:transposase, partial [Streptomyces globisporus]|uniref:transposase n=1 Tax=Streptomyces globisporus TaxID=1908 RepID=UPI0036B168DA
MGADRDAPAALAGTVSRASAGAGPALSAGILFVLYNDTAWKLLPLELGFGSGQTCWRRLDRWQKAGVFDRLHRVLLAELNAVGELDWSRTCVDGSHIRAKMGVLAAGPAPGAPRPGAPHPPPRSAPPRPPPPGQTTPAP